MKYLLFFCAKICSEDICRSTIIEHMFIPVCIKVPKIERYFLTHGLRSGILTYHVFLAMINTGAQTVAQ